MHPFDLKKFSYFAIGTILVAALLLAITAKLSPSRAGAVCDVEFSVGGGLSDDQLKSGTSKIDFAQTGALAGIGAGCDLVREKAIFGLMARYSFMHVVGDLGSEALKSDRLIEVAARAGFRLTPKSTVYGLAGWSWVNLELPASLGTKNPSGLLLGGGIEHQIGDGPWAIRGEYTWHHFSSIDAGGDKLNPDLHVVRGALVFKFGETPKSVFDDGPEAPKAPIKNSIK